MTCTNRKGFERKIFLPEGTVEQATELLVEEDWDGLETEFEKYCQSKTFVLHFF